MASPLADYIPDLNRFNMDDIDHNYIKIGGSVLALFLLAFVFFTSDPIHPGFDLVGATKFNITYIKAKYKFLKHGHDMIWEGVKKVYNLGLEATRSQNIPKLTRL